MLSDEQIKRFQGLYKKICGEEISRELAFEKALRLVQLIEATYKPIVIKEEQKNDQTQR